jgi:uncharacterized membrane protein
VSELFSFNPVAPWWVILVIMAVIAAALWIGPGLSEFPRKRRWLLFLIRSAVVLMALLALLRPALVSTVKQKQSGVIVMLMDFSRSMTLPQLGNGPSRWEAMKSMLAESSEALKKLREQEIEVRFYSFGNSLKELDSKGAIPELPEAPTDSESDIASAIYGAIERVREQRLLAILLPSDGRQNASDPQYEMVQATRLLEDSQTPLVAIPFGQSLETDELTDVSVENMPDQFMVWVKNDLTVTATIRARGFANQDIPVQLIVADKSGNEQIVDTVRQSFRDPSQAINVELRYTPQQTGQYRLIVRAVPQPGEISVRNNELPGFLTVNEGGLRILYVHGNRSWEQKFLQQSLGSYSDIHLDSIYIDPGQRDRWPFDLVKEFSNPLYDVYILHDVDARSLYREGAEKNLREIAGRVLSGKGLMMIGGYQSFGAGMYARTPLEDVLPIRMQVSEKQDFDSPIRPDIHVDRELRMSVDDLEPHYVTQLGDPDTNAGIWASLPPLDGANRFAEIKPNAGVLLKSTSGDPLLVAARIGGRVLAFAGDTTYKWYGHGHADLHKRFWRQVVLFLAGKDDQSGQNVRIELPQRRFQPNANIRFSAIAQSSDGKQLPDARFEGVLVNPAGQRNPVSIPGGGQGHIDRKLLEMPGVYQLEVKASQGDAAIGNATAEFVIFDNDKETANPAADTEQLKRLAELTGAFGGKLIPPADVPAALQEISELAPKLEMEVPVRWQLGDTLVDSLLFVFLFAALLTVDWWARKKWGLV